LSGSVTASGTNAGNYTSSITGTGNYQGTVNGGTFTINKATCTASDSTIITGGCDNSFGQVMSVNCGGLFSGGIGTLTVYRVNKVTFAATLAPVLPLTQVDGVWNGDSGANPKILLSNGINTINMLLPSGTYYYGFVFGSDSSNYIASATNLNGASCST
jgi:hypothetical protein